MKKGKLISNNAFMLYFAYVKIAGSNGACWVSAKNLEAECGFSRKYIYLAKKELTACFKVLNGKSLIHNIPGNKKDLQTDTVTIVSIWTENHLFFKNKLRLDQIDTGGGSKRHRGVGQNDTSKKEPSKKEPYKKSSSSSPSKVEPVEVVKKKTEEEDFLDLKLKETCLSPNEIKRIKQEFKPPEIVRGLEIAKDEPIKKTFMALLLTILRNPNDWEEKPKGEQLTVNQKYVSRYNSLLAKINPKLAARNEITMREDNPYFQYIDSQEYKQQTSLKSLGFLHDIADAMNYAETIMREEK